MLYGLLSFGKSFNPVKDIPDLSGKVIFITGGNIGLGYESILQFAQHNPAHIYLGARSEAKGLAAITQIQTQLSASHPTIACPPITLILCDLASLSSVQTAAREFHRQEKRLDLLMLNAGVMALPPAVTEEGYEIQFGTNHVGHALLTKLLLPTLLSTAAEGHDVRVVALSSIGHALAPFRRGIEFATLKSPQASMSTWQKYGQSKLANILFARELARRYPTLTCVAVHPGLVATNLYETFEQGILGVPNKIAKRIVYRSVQSGVCNQLWAAVAPVRKGEVVSGEYYTPVGVGGQGTAWATDDELAEKLWTWTEGELEGVQAE
ncbi:hypothetical protein BP6252_12046 [Coleophoma cylindrospora]|uniref:Uncharacterized protein n=1 Tax=Coleophoma cylindrospora TaxID=1849047 RepID=A0A3D8QFP8_9HELO|nr:hypothetical protein BP6252_12046 [Coleophoma cylindrospora]